MIVEQNLRGRDTFNSSDGYQIYGTRYRVQVALCSPYIKSETREVLRVCDNILNDYYMHLIETGVEDR